MMKKVMFTLILSVATLASVQLAYADTYGGYGANPCTQQYGNNSDCSANNLTIDKTVQNPQTQAFVDNLGVNDPKYAPDQTVNFKITVTNAGNNNLSNLTITDILPQYVTYASGGSNNNGTVTFTVSSLNVGESKTVDLAAKVVSADKLPADQGIVCVVNQAKTSLAGKEMQDNANFCIQKQTLGTTTKGGLPVYNTPSTSTTPSTGPEALGLLSLLPTGLIGAILRRRSN